MNVFHENQNRQKKKEQTTCGIFAVFSNIVCCIPLAVDVFVENILRVMAHALQILFNVDDMLASIEAANVKKKNKKKCQLTGFTLCYGFSSLRLELLHNMSCRSCSCARFMCAFCCVQCAFGSFHNFLAFDSIIWHRKRNNGDSLMQLNY